MRDDEHVSLKLRADASGWREVDGEAIVLDVGSSVYLSVNPSGTLLWGQLAAGTTRAHLVQLLVDTYGITVELARLDVDAFVAACRARDLLAS